MLSLQFEGASWWGVMRQNLEEAGHTVSLLKEQRMTAIGCRTPGSGMVALKSCQPEALAQALSYINLHLSFHVLNIQSVNLVGFVFWVLLFEYHHSHPTPHHPYYHHPFSPFPHTVVCISRNLTFKKIYVCAMCMCGAHRDHKGASDPLEPELDNCGQLCG